MSDSIVWKAFRFVDVFDIKKGFYNKKPPCVADGKYPFIGATDSNNGVTGFTSYENIRDNSKIGYGPNEPISKKIFPGKAICVTNNGSVGYAYYQESDFTCTHDVNPLYLHDRELNRYIALFLIACIEKQRVCFEYARKWRPMRMVRSQLLLPTVNGEIAWQYMETYMRNNESKLLKPIIDRLCNRLIISELGGGNLAHCNWFAFQLDELFDIKATKSSIDKKNLIKGSGTIPYITRTDKNNGIDMFVCEQPDYELDEGNVITIGLDTQTAFYQAIPFYTGQNIQVLRHPSLNRYISSFILIPIKNLMKKFNWGGYGATLTRLKRSKILLPANDDNTPNWQFMEQFMRDVENDILTSTLRYFKQLQSVNKCKMGGVIWKPLRLSKLFDHKKGNQNNMADLTPGNIPLVSAKKFDNGYKGFVSSNEKGTYEGNIISLNLDGDGGAGLAFYQPFEMALDSHVGALKPKLQLNKYHLLFISMCISKQQEMYGHGHSINESRIRGYKIMLPFNSSNEIDLDYMERYMKHIESRQLYLYLSHLSSRSCDTAAALS